MAVKKKAKPETAAAMKRRHIETLGRAWMVAQPWNDDGDGMVDWGARDYATIRASIYATVPGKQRAKNMAALLDAAVKAAARVIRRSK